MNQTLGEWLVSYGTQAFEIIGTLAFALSGLIEAARKKLDIVGMAIVTSAAQPALRGTFMTLNASVQSAAMGVASFVGGVLISRDAQGLVQNYWVAGVIGVVASLVSVWLAGRVRLHGAPQA